MSIVSALTRFIRGVRDDFVIVLIRPHSSKGWVIFNRCWYALVLIVVLYCAFATVALLAVGDALGLVALLAGATSAALAVMYLRRDAEREESERILAEKQARAIAEFEAAVLDFRRHFGDLRDRRAYRQAVENGEDWS